MLGGLFAQMFGRQAVRATDDGCSLILGLSRFDVVTPARYGRCSAMRRPTAAAGATTWRRLTFRTLSLDAAETALEAGGVRGVDRIGTSVLVPATEAFGVTLEFGV